MPRTDLILSAYKVQEELAEALIKHRPLSMLSDFFQIESSAINGADYIPPELLQNHRGVWGTDSSQCSLRNHADSLNLIKTCDGSPNLGDVCAKISLNAK